MDSLSDVLNRVFQQSVLAELFPPDVEVEVEAQLPPQPEFHEHLGPGSAMPVGKIIALANGRRGVGKTTSTINLGAALCEEGARVLLVDFDPQGELSSGFGLQGEEMERGITDLLVDPAVRLPDVVHHSELAGLDLVSSNIGLSATEFASVAESSLRDSLKGCLEPAMSQYNYVLIDCPPSLGPLTVGALSAADAVLVPMGCGYYALGAVGLLLETADAVRSSFNPQLEIVGVLATMVDPLSEDDRGILSESSKRFGEMLLKVVVHSSDEFADALAAGEPAVRYSPGSEGANEYRDLAREVLLRNP